MRFTVFGIPVRVDFFFVIGLVMIWSWAGSDRRGLFAAVLVGVLTLVHELGHALTARRYGAQTSITLNLLVGWASYATTRPLTRRQTNTISIAGPLAQIVLCIPLLIITYYLLPDAGSEGAARIARGQANLAFDVWQGAVWAGVVIGLLNLLPLWPLDGGHILDSFLTKSLGQARGRRVMLIGTLVVVGVIAVLGFSVSTIEAPYSGLEREILNAGLAPYSALYKSLPAALWDQVRYFPGHVLDFPLLLLIFCGLNSFLALRQTPQHDRAATWMEAEAPRRSRERNAPAGEPLPSPVVAPASNPVPSSVAEPVPAAVMDAERRGWIDGVTVGFPHSWGPSPWLQAEMQLRAGHEAEARVLAEGFASEEAAVRAAEQRLAEAHEAQAEGELRAAVGELEPDVWDERRLTLSAQIAAIGAERDTRAAALSHRRALVAAVERERSGGVVPAAAPVSKRSRTPTSQAPSAVSAPKVPPPAPAPEVEAPADGKSLRCRGCGTMNFPSEWYCERCGGELAAA